jgi:4-hydroxy-2,2'-bipyrrole-5-carbaldehyde O-methyltransferase
VRYSADVAGNFLRTPHKLAQGLLARDLLTWVRMEFLGAATGSGLLRALAQPRSESELASQLGVTDTGLLRSLLELGTGLGELRHRDDRWELRGSRSKALADPEMEGLAALVEEIVAYDADVYRGMSRRLAGDPPGDYLREFGPLVATASRMAEPLMSAFVRSVVDQIQPRRLLDVGCGSGIYLRCAAEACPALTAVGIDLDADVVDAARRNVAGWGLKDRVAVDHADLRDLPPELEGPWDLVLLFQNIYYFPASEYAGVLAKLRSLAPTGAVAIATVVADPADALAGHLDIVLRSTAGSYPLPEVAQLRSALTEVGFTNIDQRRLAPGQPMRAFVAS